jgi:hypothetical protein
MPRWNARIPILAALALVLLCPAGRADESSSTSAKEAAKEEPKTVEATKGPFTAYLEAQGAVEPIETVEVLYKPEAYGGELEVVESSGEGPVQAGQVLVRFKTEKIDEQLESAEADLAIARANWQRLVEEGKRTAEGAAVALAQATADKSRADEALRKWKEVEKPLRIQEAEHDMKWTENWISDQTEELAQLEKMYKADDITEETEEIVLKRSRRSLEMSKKSQGFQRQHHALLLEVTIPREEESLVLSQRRAAVDWDRVQATTPPSLEKSAREQAKAEIDLRRQEESFAKLKKDREGLVVKAPTAGYAVPGTFARGKWSGVEDMIRGLRPGQKLGANSVLFTIFQPRSLRLRTTVGESDLFKVRPGTTGTASMTAAEDATSPATVTKVARVSSDGQFEVLLDASKLDERAMPGNAVKLKLVVKECPEAVTVPEGAVAKDGEKRLVHVWADGASKPREVKVGATSGGRVEILDGLAGGERILESPPK